MKNKVYCGDALVVAAPRDVVAGEGVKVGQLIGVAATSALSGAEVTIATEGVFDVVKPNDDAGWTLGALIYWDDVAHKFTSVAAIVGQGNTLAGVAVAAAAETDVVGRLRLNGLARASEAALV